MRFFTESRFELEKEAVRKEMREWNELDSRFRDVHERIDRLEKQIHRLMENIEQMRCHYETTRRVDIPVNTETNENLSRRI